MVGGGGFLGSFLLFAAFALLLVSTISSPIFPQINFLSIPSIRASFGVFGYCLDGQCSPRQLGYTIPGFVPSGISSSVFTNDNVLRLTKALVLHPIAAGLAFIAFLVALFSDRLGYLFSSLIALLAFLVSLVAMAIDFAIFTIVRNQVNDNNSAIAGGLSASYGNAIWLTLAATIILFFSTFVVCFSCCAARRKERYAGNANRY